MAVDRVPSSQLVQKIENKRNLCIIEQKRRMEDKTIEKNDNHNLMRVIEQLPSFAANHRKSRQEEEKFHGYELHQNSGANHEVGFEWVVLKIRPIF